MKRLVAAVCLFGFALAGTAEELVVVRPDGAAVYFTVEIAATPEARRRGLMGRGALERRHGMWFDFRQEGPVVMWMKDTPIALDMLFFDAGRRLVFVSPHTQPGSLERISPPRPLRYVLELNAGEAAEFDLEAGSVAGAIRRRGD